MDAAIAQMNDYWSPYSYYLGYNRWSDPNYLCYNGFHDDDDPYTLSLSVTDKVEDGSKRCGDGSGVTNTFTANIEKYAVRANEVFVMQYFHNSGEAASRLAQRVPHANPPSFTFTEWIEIEYAFKDIGATSGSTLGTMDCDTFRALPDGIPAGTTISLPGTTWGAGGLSRLATGFLPYFPNYFNASKAEVVEREYNRFINLDNCFNEYGNSTIAGGTIPNQTFAYWQLKDMQEDYGVWSKVSKMEVKSIRTLGGFGTDYIRCIEVLNFSNGTFALYEKTTDGGIRSSGQRLYWAPRVVGGPNNVPGVIPTPQIDEKAGNIFYGDRAHVSFAGDRVFSTQPYYYVRDGIRNNNPPSYRYGSRQLDTKETT
jgi:hypothetical protein